MPLAAEVEWRPGTTRQVGSWLADLASDLSLAIRHLLFDIRAKLVGLGVFALDPIIG